MIPQETKIIFFGTPPFAAAILESLIKAGYNITAVFTQPDKKAGREGKMKKSAVKELAEKNGLFVFEPQDLKSEKTKEEIVKQQPDVIVVAAYGKIFPKTILDIPKYGAINVHASLLPKFRGASPIQEALLFGEEKTGVTLMLMDEKLDAGKIICQEEISIKRNDNNLILSQKLAKLAGKILIENLPLWLSGSIKAKAQDEKKTIYCRLIKKEDGKINWKEPAEIIFRKWKAYFPWPGIFTFFPSKKGKKRLKLIEIEAKENEEAGEIPGKVIKWKNKIAVQTKKGLIILKKIQLEGKKAVSAEDFLKGRTDFLGKVLE